MPWAIGPLKVMLIAAVGATFVAPPAGETKVSVVVVWFGALFPSLHPAAKSSAPHATRMGRVDGADMGPHWWAAARRKFPPVPNLAANASRAHEVFMTGFS